MNKKITALKVLLVTSVAALASAAHAELPTWATTAGADLGGSVSDFENMVGPIILGVTVAIVGIKLFKRFANKI